MRTDRFIFVFIITIVALTITTNIVQGCKISVSSNKYIVDDIYDAENIAFVRYNNTHRLFVTGGYNIYEIHKTPATGSFTKQPLLNQQAYMMGITQYKQYLFTLDNKGNVYLAKLADHIQFTIIYTIGNVSITNGMAADETNGDLYIANTAFLKNSGRIIRLQIDYSEGVRVIHEECWLAQPYVHHPNGLKIHKDNVLITDSDKVVRIPIDRTKSNSPQLSGITTLFSKYSYFDDLNLFVTSEGTTLLVIANYLESSLIFIHIETGELLYETSYFHFANPSALAQGAPGMFGSNQIVVTDKGIVQSTVGWGNALSYVNVTISSC